MLRTKDDAPAPTTPYKNPRWGHRGWFVAAATFVAAVVAAGVWVAVSGDPEKPAAQRPTAQASTSTASATASAATTAPVEAEACPSELPAENQVVPQSGPDAQWQGVGRIAAPFAVEHGPILNDGGVYRCYARTPTGALFAAANFMAAVTDAQYLGRVVAELTAPGPGQDRLAELVREDPVQVTGAGTPYDIAGFTFLTYDLRTTTVSIVVRAKTGGLAAVPVTLVWDGDWLVQLPPDGDLASRAMAIQTLAGYTPWSAS
jgi:hypothetical protein